MTSDHDSANMTQQSWLSNYDSASKQHNAEISKLLQEEMGELPKQVRKRLRGLKLPPADVLVLADELPTACYFDAVLGAGAPPKAAANWVMGDVMAHSKVLRFGRPQKHHEVRFWSFYDRTIGHAKFS